MLFKRKFLIGAMAGGLFCGLIHPASALSSRIQDPETSTAAHQCDIQIPVTFLPAFRALTDQDGNQERVMVDAKSTITVPTDQVALVLVDTWNGLDPGAGEEPSEMLQNMRKVLAFCRAHNVTVIHAPNHPVVDKYPQYEAIQTELKQYDESTKNKKGYLRWGPWGNPVAEGAYKIRQESRNTKLAGDNATSGNAVVLNAVGESTGSRLCNISPAAGAMTEGPKVSNIDISRFLLPLNNEYVLESNDEFRYVLWKKKISTIIYIGGALNECMLQRPTGINALAGTDGNRFPFVIVVLEDCSEAMESPKLTAGDFKKAMLEYLKFKLAFVSSSEILRFVTE